MPFHAESLLLKTLAERGFIHQCTDEQALDSRAAAGPLVGYAGFDMTADSLHIGNLVSLMTLRRFQQAGHKPIVLLGGGTTSVGDPSGRDTTRPTLSSDQIAANQASIRGLLGRFVTFGEGPTDAILVDNADWLESLAYLPFLREVGRHITLNRMLTFDSVRLRLEREQPLTFLEFNYMILQAYDFVELHKRHGCVVQMGGSDQWGNIVGGVELGRKLVGATLFGLTTPLITTASGAKMGKTAQGAVWLKAERLAPYAYAQFWRNTEDADVGRFLRLFTDLPLEEIKRLELLQGAEINAAKKVLAFETTALCHGRAAAEAAASTAEATFAQGGVGEDLPTFTLAPGQSALVIDAAVAVGLATSRGEAKRLIEQGGLRLGERVVTDIGDRLAAEDLPPGQTLRLSAGKKRHAVIKRER